MDSANKAAASASRTDKTVADVAKEVNAVRTSIKDAAKGAAQDCLELWQAHPLGLPPLERSGRLATIRRRKVAYIAVQRGMYQNKGGNRNCKQHSSQRRQR